MIMRPMLGAIAANRRRSVTPPVTQPYDVEVMADTPLAYWKLDETSGTVMSDSSGNAYNGTYGPAVTLDQPPLINTGRAVSVAGTNQRAMVVPYAAPLALTAGGKHTIELWLQYTGTENGWVASNANASNTITGWLVTIESDMRLRYQLWQFGSHSRLDSDVPLNDGLRHHIVCRYDSGTMWLTVDNVTKSGPATSFGNNPTDDVALGYAKANSPLATFNGVLDVVALYAAKLSDARVAAHYAAGVA